MRLLLFNKLEVEVARDTKEVCTVCKKRRSSWSSVVIDEDGSDKGKAKGKCQKQKVPMCGWCILYSGKSEWGFKNRGEIMYVGKAAQEHAGKYRKPIPAVDDCGRLTPEDAEKFLLGVAFGGKMMSKIGISRGR